MLPQLAFLGAARINGIMRGLQDPRLLPPDLVWTRRIPAVPASDDELTARFIGTIQIADIIADDARAAVYSMGKFQFETVKIPNVKMGIAMNQTMLNQLARLSSGVFTQDDLGLFTSWENRTVNSTRLGVAHRVEALLVAMLNDGLSYDRLGVKMNNVTFGMPSDLKVTAAIAWTSTSATPITDIQTVRRIARIRYGIELNRMTISTSALQYAFATTEFQNQARTFGWGFGGIPQPAIPLQSDFMLRSMLERILSGGDPASGAFTIEIDDRRYWSQDQDGLITSHPFQPINKVLLTSSANDGNSAAYDLANSIVTESIVAGAAPGVVGVIGNLGGPQRGPIAYVTGEHNSPSLTYWGVQRCFPRKHLLQSSAVIDAGAMTDTISVGVPFPA